MGRGTRIKQRLQGDLGGRRSVFRHGEMRLALLNLLVERPRYGYELIKELEARTGGEYKPSPGAVYPALRRFEEEGLVESEETAGSTTYTATQAGTEKAAGAKSQIDAIWLRTAKIRNSRQELEPAGLEIAGPLERLSDVAHEAVGKRDVDSELVREVLKRARREIAAFAEGAREDD
jgi:DNA-binding PadR family transcriptional regulator